MSTTTIDDSLMARAKALKLYGILAHWDSSTTLTEQQCPAI